MRILHLLAGTGWGGAERMGCTVHHLAEAHGYQSRLDAPALPEIVQAAREAVPGSDEASTWRWVRGAHMRRRQFRPDLVHAHLATPGLASAAWWVAGRTPLVLSFHLLPAARWPADYLLRVPSPLVLATLQRTRGRCVLVAVARADRAQLRRRFPRAAIALTPNLPSPPPTAAGPIAALPYPPRTLRLLSVGRLVEHKGFDRMLAALAEPALRALPWQWLIVGEGAARSALERAIARHALGERVRLLGALPSHGLFEQADLVLCPSRFEGAPLVPMEAMRAGVPVVLSDIAAHRELLPGAAAALLPERDADWPAALARWFGSRQAREALRALQVLPEADRGAMLWDACVTVYRRLLVGARPHA